MDGNKDDALKIGKEALDAEDRSRALKFLTKACRLDPTIPIDNLLAAAAERESKDQPAPESSGSTQDPSGTSTSKPSDQPSIRHRFRSNRSAAASSTTAGNASTRMLFHAAVCKKQAFEW